MNPLESSTARLTRGESASGGVLPRAALIRRRSGNARVLLPTLRGFGASTGPMNSTAYGYWTLVNDVVAVLAKFGEPGQKFHVVFHGWVRAA